MRQAPTPPGELARQQQALLVALWQPRLADATQIIASQAYLDCSAGQKRLERGLSAYRANAAEVAARVLAAAYPAVAQALGPENFEPMARQLWLREPPLRGDLAQWGEALPAFIESRPDLHQAEPHLADLARLEWALHAIASGADEAADTASLRILTEAEPSALTLVVARGCRVIESAWPIVDLARAWRAGDDAAAQALLDESALSLGAPQAAVVWRQGFAPAWRLAQPQEAQFLAALQENQSLLDSLAAAPGFDFNAWLAPALHSGLLLGARPL